MPPPGALVLDEPFSGLDPAGRRLDGRPAARAHPRGVPVLFSSHQLDLVERLCDRLVVLAQGAGSPPGRCRSCATRGCRASGWSSAATPGGSATCRASTCSTSTARPHWSRSGTSGAEQHADRRGDRARRRPRVLPGAPGAERDLPGGHRMSTQRNDRTDRSEPAWLLVTRARSSSRITDKSFLIGTAVMVAHDRRVHRLHRLAGREDRPVRRSAPRPDAVAMAQRRSPTARPQVGRPGRGHRRRARRRGGRRGRAQRGRDVDAWLHPADDGWELTSESSEQDALTDVVRTRGRTPAGAGRQRRGRRHHRRGARGRQHRVHRLPARRRREGRRGARRSGFVVRLPVLLRRPGLRHAAGVVGDRGEAEPDRRDHRRRHPAAAPARRQGARQHGARADPAAGLPRGRASSGSSFTALQVLRPGAVGPDGLVRRLLPRRLRRAGLPVGGRGLARLAHRGPPVDVDAADDADAA